MNQHYYAVIMAGGTGSKFWPVSRDNRPKQFLDLPKTGKSFLKMTYDRLSRTIPKENILIVTLEKFKHLVNEQIPELPCENLLLEPYGRNTAPCIAYATYSLLQRDPKAVFAATPADHVIKDEEAFDDAFKKALDYAAETESLMTIGLVPDRPDTNFGYIQAVGGAGAYKQNKPVKVKTFTEKPDRELAEVFIKSGEFLWNSGIFVWQANVIRNEMEKYIPQVTRLFKGWENNLGKETESEFLKKTYGDMDKISIDYGVMEKTEIDWLYPAGFHWADLDNWDDLHQYLEKDHMNNAVSSSMVLFHEEISDNMIYSSVEGKLIAVKGLKNFIVVDTPDALMICPRDDKQLTDLNPHLGMPDYEEYR